MKERVGEGKGANHYEGPATHLCQVLLNCFLTRSFKKGPRGGTA